MRCSVYASFPSVVVAMVLFISSFSVVQSGKCFGAEPKVLKSVVERFSDTNQAEVPDFQKHIVPLFGRLGCNGRACHGSFQGRGGFQLSLFGYDFKADHEALFDKESPRVEAGSIENSMIVYKPTDGDEHEGGKRYEKDGWEYNLIRNWINGGATRSEENHDLERLEVTPKEIIFEGAAKSEQLQVVAYWKDGTREDVTTLCRFSTNDEVIATIDGDGKVGVGEKGGTDVVIAYDKAVMTVPVLRPVSKLTGRKYPKAETPTKVDELVVEKLKKLGIIQSDLSDDATFLRRVTLDITGTLPTVEDVRNFLESEDKEKRSKKIDELLSRPTYAAWWTTKLCDFTGNNVDQLNNILPSSNRNLASEMWYDWIRERVDSNAPYDEIVSGIVLAVSRNPGQSYVDYCKMMSDVTREDSGKTFADLDSMPFYWARRDFRNNDERAISFAYAFMGVRIQCAQCHKHPFDQWSKDDFAEFAKLFGGATLKTPNPRRPDDELTAIFKDLGVDLSTEEAKKKNFNQYRRDFGKMLEKGKTLPFGEVVVNPPRARGGKAAPNTARLLGGNTIDLSTTPDTRTELMAWLKARDNPYFAKAFVNRVWAQYFGVGIVEPADDLSLANPPSNQALLDHLAEGFIDSGFDMKWVHREIANSRTYQLSWKPNETNESDTRNFSHSSIRRLPAELAFDAIVQSTSNDAFNVAAGTSLDGRAIAIAGVSTRQQANTPSAYALKVFGRSTRESNCDCDRTEDVSLLQTVYLKNDRDVLNMIDAKKEGWIESLAKNVNSASKLRQEKKLLESLEPKEAALQKRIRAAKENFKNKGKKIPPYLQENVKKLNQQRRTLEKSIAQLSTIEQREFEVEKVVIDAYLRTVSRYPTPQELGRSIEFINSDEDPISGTRGLLWALINTKEFIVNH